MVDGKRDPENIITFVHGTWARNSAWTQKGSELYEALSEKFGEESIPKPFLWSGKNSHKNRVKASQEFGDFMKLRTETFPESKHYVVSHSHGGNVVLYALRNEELRKSISGLLFIAVPFISCDVRDLKESLRTLIMLLSMLATGCCALPLVVINLVAFLTPIRQYASQIQAKPYYTRILSANENNEDSLLLLVFWISLMILSWFLLYKIHKRFRRGIERRLLRWAEEKQTETRERLTVPYSFDSGFPIYCATSRRDEAYWLLRLLRNFSNLPYIYWMRGTQVLIKGLITILALMGAYFAKLLIELPPDLSISFKRMMPNSFSIIEFMIHLQMVFLLWVFLYLLVSVTIQVTTFVMPVFLRAHRWGYGGESIYDNWFTDISPEQLPLFSIRNIVQKKYNARGFGLKHCLIYENKDFIEDVRALSTRIEAEGQTVIDVSGS